MRRQFGNFSAPLERQWLWLKTDKIALGLNASCVQQIKALLGKEMNGSVSEACFAI